MGFELLGFDILLDKNLKPIILEVNSYPSFAIEGGIDEKVKRNLIKDTFHIV
jgi:tubulin polyglutamylase TTLL6/13